MTQVKVWIELKLQCVWPSFFLLRWCYLEKVKWRKAIVGLYIRNLMILILIWHRNLNNLLQQYGLSYCHHNVLIYTAKKIKSVQNCSMFETACEQVHVNKTNLFLNKQELKLSSIKNIILLNKCLKMLCTEFHNLRNDL
jgi:hypothetical protein